MVFWQLTIDANDPALLAWFWARALGYQPAPPTSPETTWWQHYRARLGGEEAFDDRLFDPEGLRPPIRFQQVPEGKAGKNRLHLDLYPTERDNSLSPEQRVDIIDAKVAELVALGATVARWERGEDPEDPFYFVVMWDPEGNEFCVGLPWRRHLVVAARFAIWCEVLQRRQCWQQRRNRVAQVSQHGGCVRRAP